MDPDSSIPESSPSVFNYVLSFLLLGVAWGFTTPFIRRAAADFNARQEKQSQSPRGRSQSQSHSRTVDGEEEQELLPTEDEGIRRRSGSSQRQRQGDREIEGDEDDIPTPAWKNKQRKESWLKAKVVGIFWTVVNLLRTPAYSIPLVVNLTGSIWFFLLVGKHGMFSLTLSLGGSLRWFDFY